MQNAFYLKFTASVKMPALQVYAAVIVGGDDGEIGIN